MRAAVLIGVMVMGCQSAPDESAGVDRHHGAKVPRSDAAILDALHEDLSMFFRMDESGEGSRMDAVSGVELVPWQRTGFGQYAVDARGTTAVSAAIGDGQHVVGSKGYHFATWNVDAMNHAGGSFTWAGWVSVDSVNSAEPYLDNQTLLAKWNGIPDTAAPYNHREYRVWHDQALSQWRFEVSADGLEGEDNSKVVTHPARVERDRLYFVEAWHDAARETVNLRVSTREERGSKASEPWSKGVFSGEADLDVGAQNTCTDAHLQGVVDALGYWNRVLHDDESLALWNGGAGLEL
ncbi:MAG TPA: hypothetical protein VJR89_20105 [Polyangiales bacterium]|nr:hypothetical protein [Polyangiales bacterium]